MGLTETGGRVNDSVVVGASGRVLNLVVVVGDIEDRVTLDTVESVRPRVVLVLVEVLARAVQDVVPRLVLCVRSTVASKEVVLGVVGGVVARQELGHRVVLLL